MFFPLNDGKTYGVKFQRAGTTTLAVLYRVEDDSSLTCTNITGIAILHPNDRFVKSTGRKVALADLLAQFKDFSELPMLTREDRREIWNIYFKTHKK